MVPVLGLSGPYSEPVPAGRCHQHSGRWRCNGDVAVWLSCHVDRADALVCTRADGCELAGDDDSRAHEVAGVRAA
eukprot:733169-Prymnesium_polylepis.2